MPRITRQFNFRLLNQHVLIDKGNRFTNVQLSIEVEEKSFSEVNRALKHLEYNAAEIATIINVAEKIKLDKLLVSMQFVE